MKRMGIVTREGNVLYDTKEEESLWMLVRTDEAGNSFLVKDELMLEEARSQLREFSSGRHKQTYSILSYYSNNSRASLIKRYKIFV